jgi:hypothetical protein
VNIFVDGSGSGKSAGFDTQTSTTGYEPFLLPLLKVISGQAKKLLTLSLSNNILFAP